MTQKKISKSQEIRHQWIQRLDTGVSQAVTHPRVTVVERPQKQTRVRVTAEGNQVR